MTSRLLIHLSSRFAFFDHLAVRRRRIHFVHERFKFRIVDGE